MKKEELNLDREKLRARVDGLTSANASLSQGIDRLSKENSVLTSALEAVQKENARLWAENKTFREMGVRVENSIHETRGLSPGEMGALKENQRLTLEIAGYKRIIPLVRDLAKLIDDVTKL